MGVLKHQKYINKRSKSSQDKLIKKANDYKVSHMKEYIVRSEDELLEFLLKAITNQSKNNIKSLLSKRYIAVNGLCVTQYNYKVYQKDIVQLSKDPFPKNDKTLLLSKKKEQRKDKVSEFRLDIIYEDNDFIVINKPAGLLAVESDKEKTNTAYKQVLSYMQSEDKNLRAFQVHRIDKETSGVLLFTKTNELREQLKKNWNKLVVTRGYYAIIYGQLEKKKDTIVSYLKETSTHVMYDSKKEGEGLKAITHYNVLKESSKFSLLDVKIDSGRKNQIRVVFSTNNTPIIGDEKYGNGISPIKRMGLHAYILEIINPNNNKKYIFKAPIPSSFNRLFS